MTESFLDEIVEFYSSKDEEVRGINGIYGALDMLQDSFNYRENLSKVQDILNFYVELDNLKDIQETGIVPYKLIKDFLDVDETQSKEVETLYNKSNLQEENLNTLIGGLKEFDSTDKNSTSYMVHQALVIGKFILDNYEPNEN